MYFLFPGCRSLVIFLVWCSLRRCSQLLYFFFWELAQFFMWCNRPLFPGVVGVVDLSPLRETIVMRGENQRKAISFNLPVLVQNVSWLEKNKITSFYFEPDLVFTKYQFTTSEGTKRHHTTVAFRFVLLIIMGRGASLVNYAHDKWFCVITLGFEGTLPLVNARLYRHWRKSSIHCIEYFPHCSICP